MADFNQDGDLDLTVGGATTAPYIYLLFGDGAGGFVQGPAFGSKPAETTVTADFNGDGYPDVLSTSYDGGSVEVYLGHGDGTFGAALTTKAPGDLTPTIGDFNNDGVPDVAVARRNDSALRVLLGNGDGTFSNGDDLVTERLPQFPLVADFNGDGNADLGVANYFGNTFDVFLGNGDGTFQQAIVTAAPTVTYSAAGDLNRDGKIDLVLASLGTKVFLGNGDGTFQPPQTLTEEYGYTHIADIDGDGNLDVATTSSYTSIEIFRGDGHGLFHGPLSFLVGSQFVGDFALHDFNRDGRLDMAVTNLTDAVNVILSTNRRPPGRF